MWHVNILQATWDNVMRLEISLAHTDVEYTYLTSDFGQSNAL